MLVRKALACAVVLVVFTSCGVATAEWQPLTGEPVSLASLQGQSLTVDDKDFIGFDIFGIAIGGPIPPSAETVFVQGGWDDATGDIGLRFILLWAAISGQTIEANISFNVAILPDYQEWFIKDVSMLLTGVSATGTGSVHAGETVWDAPIPGGAVLASLSCSKQEGDGDAHLTDWAEFDPVKAVWVRKDILITGGSDGAAHLSEMFQFFSQVPEPATLSLLVAGGLGLVMRRRK